MRFGFWLVAAMLAMPTVVCSGGSAEENGYLAKPSHTSSGVVCTNTFGSALYVVRNDTLHELASGPGIGLYYTVSPSGDRVGCKVVTEAGLQIAAVLDPANGRLRHLTGPEPRVGQVSFTTDGRMAFTVGEDLVITNGLTAERYGLGTYANIAPVSADARFVAYNDIDDQLWLMDLGGGNRACITDRSSGFFAPVWSPSGSRLVYSTLHGILSVYDLASKRTYRLGPGSNPSWTPDSHTLLFHRTISERDVVVASDIYSIAYDGSNERCLTETTDEFAMDPSVTPDGRAVLFHTCTSREVRVQSLDGTVPLLKGAVARIASAGGLTFRPSVPSAAPASVSALDIPYVHQVYDTPDWFNGHWACAPTQAIMVLAYYHVLPPWVISCSWPSRHSTSWGNYVASPYRFKGIDFVSAAEDPNGVNGQGGYGYMWTGSGSPHTRMAEYYRTHGFSATQTEGTAYSTAAADISAGYPFSMCVLLTTSGHLVLAHGFGAEAHTLVFNDPYGNKNQGYMNAAGKNVLYDWPGYNNGYQNLTQVAWCISTRYTALAVADTVVDDLQFSSGFTLNNAPPASMSAWRDLNRGFQGHLWYTLTTAGPVDTFFAEWRPVLPAEGDYDVQAFIELSNATDARYEITHAGGRDSAFINQKLISKNWVSLGVFHFNAGEGGAVRLGHRSSVADQEIVFDAVRWVRVAPTHAQPEEGGSVGMAFALDQNYPNPFNPSTRLRYSLPNAALVRLEILNTLGQIVAVLRNGAALPGSYVQEWAPGPMASGIYFARLRVIESGGNIRSATVKMALTR
ncbi:MAG: C39 family peptidase [Bacteroidetes bacterium]|nr:C39 family peptidase [Bacteroidota bacterium]